ncbi:hypothetical protein BLNAU_18676 [Blattamonas nauphoetae]|uniref:Uncharacterized protein n=1 Tax=Blattamonas nauphoetae TaxID=2049346 RepID=A0ABQ9X412_9EUKA|nr:hypothetical protein BLNAU_18676 [Blattamonas nauphoetae]
MPIALATLRGLHQLTIPATSATKGLPSSFLPSALHSLLFKKVDDIYADHRFIEYQPALYLSTNTSKNSKKRRDETRRPSALPAKRVSVLAGRKRSRKTAIVFTGVRHCAHGAQLFCAQDPPGRQAEHRCAQLVAIVPSSPNACFVQSLISRLFTNVDTLKSLHEMLVTGEHYNHIEYTNNDKITIPLKEPQKKGQIESVRKGTPTSPPQSAFSMKKGGQRSRSQRRGDDARPQRRGDDAIIHFADAITAQRTIPIMMMWVSKAEDIESEAMVTGTANLVRDESAADEQANDDVDEVDHSINQPPCHMLDDQYTQTSVLSIARETMKTDIKIHNPTQIK